MNGMAIIALAAALGVDVGWRPTDSGGLEYIIQIEPQLVGSLLGGQAIASDVPPMLRPLRSLRVRVGRDTLPREMPEESTKSTARSEDGDSDAIVAPPQGTAVGWQPIEGGHLEYLIQIDPEAVEALSEGEELLFDLRAAPGEVSSLRVTVGGETLPQIAPPAERATEAIAADDAQPADESQPADETDSAGETPAAADSSEVSSDDAEPQADESAGPTLGDPGATAMRDGDGVDPLDADTGEASGAEEAPALTDAEAKQAADIADNLPQPRQALRPEEKPPGRFVPDKDSQPIAAQGDAGTGEGDGARGGAAFVSTGGARENGNQQSDEEGNDGVVTPSPSAEGADKPEESAAASDPWWASRTTTVLGLGGSLGANVYLIWLFWGLRRRYRDLLDQLALRPAA